MDGWIDGWTDGQIRAVVQVSVSVVFQNSELHQTFIALINTIVSVYSSVFQNKLSGRKNKQTHTHTQTENKRKRVYYSIIKYQQSTVLLPLWDPPPNTPLFLQHTHTVTITNRYTGPQRHLPQTHTDRHLNIMNIHAGTNTQTHSSLNHLQSNRNHSSSKKRKIGEGEVIVYSFSAQGHQLLDQFTCQTERWLGEFIHYIWIEREGGRERERGREGESSLTLWEVKVLGRTWFIPNLLVFVFAFVCMCVYRDGWGGG